MDPALHPAYNGGATLQFGRALTDALASDDWRVVVDTMFTPSAPRALVDGTYAELMSVDAATRRGQLTAPRPDLVDVLGDVRQPTLVIHGERDDTLLVESARFFAAAIPDARIAVLGESGHAPFLEEPERFDRVLVTFLDELDLGSTP
jgi:pimeloyl-ACP methyl ester carboxylesterase